MGIRSREAPVGSPARVHKFVKQITVDTGNGTTTIDNVGSLPGDCRLVDVIIEQSVAGGATSWSANVAIDGTAALTTAGVLTAAIGTYKALDAVLGLAALSGCTRPVIDTAHDTGTKGQAVTVTIIRNGNYSTGFSGNVTCLFEDRSTPR